MKSLVNKFTSCEWQVPGDKVNGGDFVINYIQLLHSFPKSNKLEGKTPY